MLSRIVFIMIWLYRLSFCAIETRPCGKAEWHNNLAQFTLTQLKMIYHAKRVIAPAIHLFMNQYSQATSYHSLILYLLLKLLLKLHKEAGEPLTHCGLLFLQSFVSPRFYCIDRYQHLFSLALRLSCWPNQSVNIWRGSNILLLSAFRILDAIVVLYIWFIVSCRMIFAVIWIIQVAIPV